MAEKCVIDASVAAKWFLRDEAGVSEAIDLLTDLLSARIQGLAPALIRYELPNSLLIAFRRKRISANVFEHDVIRFFRLPIRYMVPSTQSMFAAVRFARDYRLTVYDAAYLALARETGARLAVADKRLAKAARAAGLDTQTFGLRLPS